MHIGLIGLGHMGLGMAKRLLLAGHRLTVYNRTPSKVEALASLKAQPANSPRAAAAVDILITMLADDSALEAVLEGPQGAYQGLPAGAVHLSMSTISVGLARQLEAPHRKAGVRLVGAPVFGRPEAAESGKLFILAGGDPQALRRCAPVFDALSQKVFVTGAEAWTAHLMKVLGNFMLMSSVEAMAEAMAVARKSGLDAGLFLETMAGSIFSAPFYRNYGAMMVERRYEPAGFGLPLAMKDMGLAMQAASQVQAPLPLGSLLQDRAASALARGFDKLDLAALGRIAEENAGVRSV